MIKINLLPTKKKAPKKVMDLQKQLILGVLIIVLVAIAMWFYWNRQKNIIDSLEKQKISAETRLREQDNILKEVKNVEDERKRVAEKIGVIEQLKKNQSGPVRLLDEISKALPIGVNVTLLNESSSNINIEGEAFTNDDVVRFINNLKASRFLTDVMLLETRQMKSEGTDFYKYKLQFAYKGL